jgi:hypothetical protein
LSADDLSEFDSRPNVPMSQRFDLPNKRSYRGENL